MINKKRVGLLIPNLHSGGAERVMSIISEILVDKGYDVFIFLFDSRDICYTYKGKLIDLKSKTGNNYIAKVIKRISRIIKLSYYEYILDLNVIISFLRPANCVNYYSIGGARKILSCRGYYDYLSYSKCYAEMIKKTSSFIVQTEKMKSDFIDQYDVDALKIRVLNNPINLKIVEEQASENIESNVIEFINKHKTICTMGSFKKEKGYWHLIKAFSIVKESIPNAGLIFIGHRGEIENNIIGMADSFKYKDDIMFLGYQQNPFKYISKCKIYVCSSIYEGFPNALLEAMACGTAVISTDCKTGPRELLAKGISKDYITKDVSYVEYGVLVPELDCKMDFSFNGISGNILYMAKAIIALLSNQALLEKYSSLAKHRAEEFDLNKFTDNLIRVIEQPNYTGASI